MGKNARGAGPSHNVPAEMLRLLVRKRDDGDTLGEMALFLNQAGVTRPNHDGVPEQGMWDAEAVRDVLDAIDRGELR